MNTKLRSIARGGLIVIEGTDRSGKTTFSKNLVMMLESLGHPAKYMNFPDRETGIGTIINSYLQSAGDLNDETIHLLFSANRWEKVTEMKNLLVSGTTLVIDRYAFSGVAYSAAKGLNFNWCKSPDIGLPKPDIVYFLKIDPDIQATRKEFGNERYEITEFQEKVSNVYKLMTDDSWEILNAAKSTDQLLSDVCPTLTSLLSSIKNKSIDGLWIHSDNGISNNF